MNLVIIAGLAIAGGLGAQYVRLPGGVMLGSMLAVAAFALAKSEPLPALPPVLITGSQMVLGALLGVGFTWAAIRQIQSMLWPSLLTLALLLAVSYALGLLLAWMAGVDTPTALFSLAPGGMNFIAATAEATGANGGVVAVIHLVRIILTIVVVPVTIQWFLPRN